MTSAALPTGPVTFCFTDIEGSTRLVLDLGTDRWEPILARHRALVRAACSAHGGVEVQVEGDGFFVSFADPVHAIEASVAAQRAIGAEPWPADAVVRIRIGLHLGEGRLDADDSYVGPDVHRAARIAASGHGGQVVCSRELVDEVRARLPAGVTVRSLGEHRLKDLRPQPLWDLVVAGLPADFPPIRSLDARPNNLPTQLTTFVGREAEIEEALALVARSRLVTLSGPGGTGKTRLALHLAAAAADRFPDGVWFVPLETIVDPALVLPAIATVLGLMERPGVTPHDRLVEALAGRRVLLVLDNLEQVLDSSPAVGSLLRDLPELHIVATSRAVLRVSGEQEYPVPGLPIPGPSGSAGQRGLPGAVAPDPAELMTYDAIRLFVARAAAARPGFQLNADNAAAVAAICARLEGMPLAIELAAARVRVLPPAAIVERLGRTLDLLSGGARDLPERQQSLRGAITWSYEVLDEPCRRLLERLAVFAGGAALEDAEIVCGPPDELGQEVLDGLTTLVEQSLVRLEGEADARYGLLVPIREFALERLDGRGDAERIRHRHALRFLDLAESAAPSLTGPERKPWLDRLDVELENLRAALDHLVAHGDAAAALRFVSAAWRFWQSRGHLVEGRERTQAVLAMPGAQEQREERLLALTALGGLAWWLGDHPLGAEAYAEVLAARREDGDTAAIARALYDYAFPLMFASGDAARVREVLEEARERFAGLGDADNEARAWWGLANVAYVARDTATGRTAAGRAADHFRRANLPFDLSWALYTLGQLALVDGASAEAARTFAESLEMFWSAHDVAGVAMAVDGLASAAWHGGDLERAARLSGAVARLERVTGTGLNPWNRAISGLDAERLRSGAGTAAWWVEGEAMELPAVVAYASALPDVPVGDGA